MTPLRVLIVDANEPTGAELRTQLRQLGFEAATATSIGAALGQVGSFKPAVVLLDAQVPGIAQSSLAGDLAALGSHAAVVVLSAEAEAEAGAALAALGAGADGYLVRPILPERLAAILNRAGERRALRVEIARLRERIRGRLALVGASPELGSALELMRRVAPTKATILLQGETGVGKHHLAQVVHELSPRRERPFVAVNCAARAEALLDALLFGHEPGTFEEDDRRRAGQVEVARGGTLYLHEVGQLAPGLQVKLLRVLQEGVFERLGGRELLAADVRVVVGSSRDLAEEVRGGRFRDDLYYRLNVVSATLPPLRDRKADIPALVAHLLERRPRPAGSLPLLATAGLLSACFAYPWPGNLRELTDVVTRAAAGASGGELRAEDLPAVLLGGPAEMGSGSGLIPGATLFEIEREAILRTLEQADGSTARAAVVLGISVRKIQYRLKEYRAGQPTRRQAAGVVAFGGEGRLR